MAEAVITLTDENFEQEVLKSDKPVLVDFWAPWCAPCKAVGPIVAEIAAENADKIKVGKVNTDENQTTAANYGIRSIPTLMIFKDGAVVKQLIGAAPKEVLVRVQREGRKI